MKLVRILEASREHELLLYPLLEEELGILDPFRFSRQFASMLNSTCHTLYIAFNSENKTAGYTLIHWLRVMWTDKPEALISQLYVGRNDRNAGIGRQLIEKAVKEAHKSSASRIWLENNRDNPIYRNGFYSALGWQERLDLAVFEYPPRKVTDR